MTDPRWDAVDRYASDLLVRPPEALDVLMLLAQSIGARRILEISTLAGYSAIWLARALPPGGSLVALEVEPRQAVQRACRAQSTAGRDAASDGGQQGLRRVHVGKSGAAGVTSRR
jgi:predicted O-methyltransferase YrrM